MMESGWLEYIPHLVSSLAALASAITAFLVWDLTRRQTDPRLLVTIEQIQDGSVFFGVVLRNIGASPAFTAQATVSSQFRPVNDVGVLNDIKKAFSHTWPMIAPEKSVSFSLDRDKVWAERNSGAKLIVEVRYAKKYGKRPKYSEVFDITPSWKDGQLISGPSIWREIDSRIRPVKDSVVRIENQLTNIARALEDKDDE